MVGLQRSGLRMETLEGLRDIGGFDTLEVSDRGSVNIHRRNDTIGHGGDDAVTDECSIQRALPKC